MKLVVLFLVLGQAAPSQERIDHETNARIRVEAVEHSQVMRLVHVLTDRYGPRLTGSPNYAEAARWTAAQLDQWGLKNVHLEPFDLGYGGWANEFSYGYLTAPVRQNLGFQPFAWTPSTNGPVSAPIVQLIIPDVSSKEEMSLWLHQNASRVKGKIVMTGRARAIPVDLREPLAKRLNGELLRKQYEPKGPATQPTAPPRPAGASTKRASGLAPGEAVNMLDEWLASSGALLIIRDAGRPFGLIQGFGRVIGFSAAIPTIILRNEDYGRIERLLADGEDVRAEFYVANRMYPEGRTVNNVLAEIPGTDKALEVVMIGAHLDSWHVATGATDNAIGSAIVMEAVRILNALGRKPRRTIRVALWAGEEEGLLGSAAYVKQHLGTFEKPQAEFDRLDCYINVDTGTGRLRGARVFGPEAAATVVRAILEPFAGGGAGIVGAIAGRDRFAGGADTGSFRVAGLPAIGWDVDPIEYNLTQHTNLDTYERILPEDAVNSVNVVAALAWHLANRDPMVPRFAGDQIPPPPGGQE